jgi:hypothetical protein
MEDICLFKKFPYLAYSTFAYTAFYIKKGLPLTAYLIGKSPKLGYGSPLTYLDTVLNFGWSKLWLT